MNQGIDVGNKLDHELTGDAVGSALDDSKMIPFSRPHVTGMENHYLAEALSRGEFSGNGTFGQRCADHLRDYFGSASVLVTPSCTAALELGALLSGIGEGDEVLVSSFAFPSIVSAFALRGATPVFVDIREDTLGMDEALIEQAFTDRTRAISLLHYGGLAGDVERVIDFAASKNLRVIEDNAHGTFATHNGRPLGTFGDLGALSFHATKNIQVGEGGALLINDPELVDRAEILQEKGTDRQRFMRGDVPRYEWIEIGSSPLLGELPAAALWAQLQGAQRITAERIAICNAYRDAFSALADAELLTLPAQIAGSETDGHIFYFLARDLNERTRAIDALREANIGASFHYVPLHSAPAGRRYGRVHGSLETTDRVASTIVRLPVWPGLPADVPARAAAVVAAALKQQPGARGVSSDFAQDQNAEPVVESGV
jgi:dTDP-4-amino-4,6-dideoxygalactose transaminase